MHTNQVTLSEILSSHRQHIIPVFQRPYSWDRKNWLELWSDIELLIGEEDKSLEHFLGPIIIDKGDTGSYVPEKYLVIDGQQRLVTLSVLLCALRDIATKLDDENFAASVQPYLSFNTPRGETHHRLIPRSDDKTAFRKVVGSSFNSEDNKQLIIRAYKYFLRKVNGVIRTNSRPASDYLNELFEIAVARFKFVSITLDKTDDPTRIYESMNSKRKDLLIADLIRNYVLMHLPSEQQDKFFSSRWEAFEKQFADNDEVMPDAKELEDFYYRYLIAKRDYFAKRLVYSEYKDNLKKFTSSADSNQSIFDALSAAVADQKRFATYYRRIVHPELEDDHDLREAFLRFSFLDAVTATPFLMSLYDRYDDDTHPNHIGKSTFLQMINAMESFIIRRSILRLRTRGYGLDFAQAVRKSESLDELWQHFDDRDWPQDDAIKDELMEFPLYLRERKKSRLILEQLEISFGHKEQVDLSDRERIQIEHIIPQKKPLSPQWQEMLGDGAEGIHATFHQTLGNLTLTGYNQELGTKSFHEKKLEYAKHGSGSHLELNSFVLEQDRWTETEITDRARQLTDRFIEIWPRPKMPKQNES